MSHNIATCILSTDSPVVFFILINMRNTLWRNSPFNVAHNNPCRDSGHPALTETVTHCFLPCQEQLIWGTRSQNKIIKLNFIFLSPTLIKTQHPACVASNTASPQHLCSLLSVCGSFKVPRLVPETLGPLLPPSGCLENHKYLIKGFPDLDGIAIALNKIMVYLGLPW